MGGGAGARTGLAALALGAVVLASVVTAGGQGLNSLRQGVVGVTTGAPSGAEHAVARVELPTPPEAPEPAAPVGPAPVAEDVVAVAEPPPAGTAPLPAAPAEPDLAAPEPPAARSPAELAAPAPRPAPADAQLPESPPADPAPADPAPAPPAPAPPAPAPADLAPAPLEPDRRMPAGVGDADILGRPPAHSNAGGVAVANVGRGLGPTAAPVSAAGRQGPPDAPPGQQHHSHSRPQTGAAQQGPPGHAAAQPGNGKPPQPSS